MSAGWVRGMSARDWRRNSRVEGKLRTQCSDGALMYNLLKFLNGMCGASVHAEKKNTFCRGLPKVFYAVHKGERRMSERGKKYITILQKYFAHNVCVCCVRKQREKYLGTGWRKTNVLWFTFEHEFKFGEIFK